MERNDLVMEKVFVQPQSVNSRMKHAFRPWKRRSSSLRSMPVSLAAPSDLNVVHDSVFESNSYQYDAPFDAAAFNRPTDFNRWDHYLDLYSEGSDTDSLVSRYVPDGSEYEPEELMEDSDVPLSLKKPSKFRKFLRPAAYSRTPPVIEEIDPPETQLVVQPPAKPRRVFRSRVPSAEAPSAPIEMPSCDISDSAIVGYLRQIPRLAVLFDPFNKLIEIFPDHKLVIVGLELLVAMWLLYQLSIVIETIALAVRALCIPLIIVGRVFGYL